MDERLLGDTNIKAPIFQTTIEDARKWGEKEKAVKKVQAAKDDPFTILSLPRSATGIEVERAYKKLALLVHPDKAAETGLPEEELKKAFQKLQWAKETLLDRDKRAQWEQRASEELDTDYSGSVDSTNIILGSARCSETLKEILKNYLKNPIPEGEGIDRIFFRTGLAKIVEKKIKAPIKVSAQTMPKNEDNISPPSGNKLTIFEKYITNVFEKELKTKTANELELLNPSEFPDTLPSSADIQAQPPKQGVIQTDLAHIKQLSTSFVVARQVEAPEHWEKFLTEFFNKVPVRSPKIHTVPSDAAIIKAKGELKSKAKGRNLPRAQKGARPTASRLHSNKMNQDFFLRQFPVSNQKSFPVWFLTVRDDLVKIVVRPSVFYALGETPSLSEMRRDLL